MDWWVTAFISALIFFLTQLVGGENDETQKNESPEVPACLQSESACPPEEQPADSDARRVHALTREKATGPEEAG